MTSPSSRAVPARHSIRWAFVVWVGALLLGATALAFAIVYDQTTSQLSGQIDHDLRADVSQLQQSLRLDHDEPITGSLNSATHYLSAQPFRSSSTMLFILGSSRGPISNYPELFHASAADDRESPAQQRAENRLSAAIRVPRLGLHEQRVVDVGVVRTLERRVTLAGRPVIVGAGEPLLALHRAQEGLIHSFLLAALLLVLAVFAGAYLIGNRITAPLRRIAEVAAGIDAGDVSSRAPRPPDERSEVGVLTTSINHMLDRIERGILSQREFVADASHELRTPLTVIQGQLEVLSHQAKVDRAELDAVTQMVNLEVGRMRRIVDDLLLLAQSERPDFLHIEQIPIASFLEEILDGATLIADRRFELVWAPDGTLRADPDRLAQALRNLITNAIDHTAPTSGTIRLDALVDPDRSLRIRISDNGPGIPPDQIERIFSRFHRVDPQRGASGLGGSGLGLSIVRAIVEAHGGSVGAENRTDDTGAVFEIVLPRFEPRPAAVRRAEQAVSSAQRWRK